MAALALGVALGAGIALFHGSGKSATLGTSTLPGRPAATWAPQKQRAPGFRLVDERGAPISLARFHGRPVIVTFIDPACTTLCPLEAQELDRAEAQLPPGKRPEIIAVSVNPWADSPANFRKDARKWRLVRQWHWAAGRYAQLAPVWKSYKIGVLDQKKKVRGVVAHNISHTEASIVVDASGYERALFLFPFQGRDVATVVRQLTS